LITDLSKAYELLGLKPGVSSTELKAAHRDLAKVWHPDRFVHDPRLQEKAQEKLKEINEAYELLISGKTPRAAPPPPRAAETVYPPVYTISVDRRSALRGASWKSVMVVLLFLAVFAGTTKVLLDQRTKPQPQVEAEPVPAEVATPPAESSTRSDATRKPGHADSTVEEEPAVASDTTSSAPTPALATVTVLIDPESGLLAKPDCPVRSRMTYPSGSQPSAYCNVNHAPPPKESKLKSIKEKILR
jgi:DnaJ-like protein